MKKQIIKLLLKIAVKLYQIQVSAHNKQMQYREQSLAEVNAMIQRGEYKFVKLSDPKTKQVCLTLRKV